MKCKIKINNRTVSLRVIPGGKSTRVEIRFPGADMNPYHSIAAAVASGLYGIRNKLKLEVSFCFFLIPRILCQEMPIQNLQLPLL